MIRIFKYVVPIADKSEIVMPRGAVLISSAEQNGQVVVWAKVDSTAPRVTRILYVVGTGHSADHIVYLPFVGTVVTRAGALVWHLFDGGEEL